jgi:hypothetical protein
MMLLYPRRIHEKILASIAVCFAACCLCQGICSCPGSTNAAGGWADGSSGYGDHSANGAAQRYSHSD